jgi:hypothetical protein
MSDEEDFWPSDLGVATEVTPVTILKEQAARLGQRTKNFVEAKVFTVAKSQGFHHSLYLFVPTLSNYRFELLSVYHLPSIYPIKIFDMTDDKQTEVSNLEEFKRKLREILSSDRVKRVVNNLMTYATTTQPDTSP